MKTKFSKRALSFLLSILMIITSVPMTALTAFADETQDYTGEKLVAKWDFANSSFANFGATNTRSKIYTVPVIDSVNGIKMYATGYDAQWSKANGGAYCANGYMYYDGMGAYLDNTMGVKIKFSLTIKDNKTQDYGLFSLGKGHSGTNFYDIINVHSKDNGGVYANASTTACANIGTMTATDYNVEINLAQNGTMSMTVNGTTYNIPSGARPSDLNHLALGVCQDGAYPGYTVKYVEVYKTKTVTVTNPNNKSCLDSAMAAFEAKISDGNIYTNSLNAYDAYVACQKAIDMGYYGSTTVDFGQKAADLLIQTSFMESWTSKTFNAKGGYVLKSSDEGSVEQATDSVFSGLSYASVSYSDDNNTSNNVNEQSGVTGYLRFPAAIMVYTTANPNPTSPIMVCIAKTGTWDRTVNNISAYNMSDLSFVNSNWKGVYKSGDNWDYGWVSTQADLIGTSGSSKTQKLNEKNKYTGVTNILKFVGSFAKTGNQYTEFYKTITPGVSVVHSNGTLNMPSASKKIYVVNYQALTDALGQTGIMTVLNGGVSSYKEGGLRDFFSKLQAATDLNISAYSDGSVLGPKLETAVTGLYNYNSNISSDSTQYQALRNAFDVYTDDDYGKTAMQVMASNLRGYDKSGDADEQFTAAYTAAQTIMNNVNSTPAYNQGAQAASAATTLKEKLDALQKLNITVPTVSANNVVIGPDDTVAVTIPSTDGYSGKYNVTYSNGTTRSGALAQGSNTFTPFNGSTASSTATVVFNSVLDGDDSADVVCTYTLLNAPSFNVEANEQLTKTQTVTITSNNPGVNGLLIEYSYNGTDWNTYNSDNGVNPFADNNTATVNLYARVKNGSYTSAAVNVPLVRKNTFAITSTDGKYFNDNTVLTVVDANDFYDDFKYVVKVDGGAAQTYNYNKTTGITCEAYSSASVISVYAYAVNNPTYRTEEVTFIQNGDGYNVMFYQESFTRASINSAHTALVSTKTTADVTGNVFVVDGKGNIDAKGNSHSYRENVLKVGASNNGNPQVTFSDNGFTYARTRLLSQTQGATISFWRYVDADGAFGSNALCGLSFVQPDSNGKHYFNINPSTYTKFTNGGGASSTNNITIQPDAQDLTQHEAGSTRGKIWMHIAVTIDPSSGIVVYANGVPHPFTVSSDSSSEFNAGGNDAHLAQEVLNFITNDATTIKIGEGNGTWTNSKDIYYDDIRFYAQALTQVEIINNYTDEFADVQTKESTSHDPTNVTVYTLAGGKQVGIEYIEYHNVPESQIIKRDYYSFGTGMTIYHSEDNQNWEVIGDSQGRCGYQNQDLFGAEYHTALAEPLDYAARDNRTGAGHLQWAPHVMYNLQLDKWVYYGSTSSWGSQTSSVFMCVSTDGTPLHYRYECEVQHSSGHPNAIDSCVYYSADYQHLYMLYGSWGGNRCIYVREINLNGKTSSVDTTGQPLANGIDASLEVGSTDGGSGEGAYVVHENVNGTVYYYLYISYGQNTGSYVERVYRSTSPDSGFVDIDGTSALDTTTKTTHGNQILSPFYIPVYNYLFVSTGHNSVYKAQNTKGETVTLNSVHARPLASERLAGKFYALPDNVMAKCQSDDGVTGNTNLINQMGYSEHGWPVMLPNQFNENDTIKSDLTAKDIEGMYTGDELALLLAYNWAEHYRFTIMADPDLEDGTPAKTGIFYGTNGIGVSFRYTFELKKAPDGTNLFNVYKGDTLVREGVAGLHYDMVNGRLKATTQFGTVDPSSGRHVWAYQTGEIPRGDQENSPLGNIVETDHVIYTHADSRLMGDKKLNHTLYGQRISDDPNYSSSTAYLEASLERCTKLVSKYPYYIDTKDAGAIYCLSDNKLAKQGYSGGNYYVEELNDGQWVTADGQVYNGNPATATVDLYKQYVLKGYVSDYFAYDSTTNKYREGGISLVIMYTDGTNHYGEYEYFYVQANPGMAHSVVGIRDQYQDFITQANKRKLPVLVYSRFAGSEGFATQISSTALSSEIQPSDTSMEAKGIGSFMYLGTFGDYASTGYNGSTYDTDYASDKNTDKTYNYTSPQLISNKFDFNTDSEGVNSGAYSLAEFSSTANDWKAYYRYTYPVDTNYYVDYSDPTNGIITRDGNNKPTGYKFNFFTSNLYWPNGDTDLGSMPLNTSTVNNKTGITATYAVINATNDYKAANNDVSGMTYTQSLTHNLGTSGPADIMTSNGTVQKAFANVPSTAGANNTWTGKITFTGKETVRRSKGTDAESYSNFILEQGNVKQKNNNNFSVYNTYQFYNIGVATCDKGSVRSFLEKYAFKRLDVQKDEDGNILKVLVDKDAEHPDGDLLAKDYSIASYQEYLDALGEAYYFLYNNHNTTYNGTSADDPNATQAMGSSGTYQYTTAYRSFTDEYKTEGTPVYNSVTAGDSTDVDIFGENAGTKTDPIQTMITDRIIAAYDNLFTISEYEEVEEAIDSAVGGCVLKDNDNKPILDENGQVQTSFTYDGEFTQVSIDKYEEAVDLAVDHIYKYTGNVDGMEEIPEDYWRYTQLTTEEYMELKDFVTNTHDSLMPLLDVDKQELDELLPNKDAELDTGIYRLEDGNTVQKYSLSSWVDMHEKYVEGDRANTDAVDTVTGKCKEKYTYGPEKTATVLGKDYVYNEAVEQIPANYSVYQKDVINSYEALNATSLKLADKESAYQSFDAAAEVVASIDHNKYTDEAIRVINLYLAQYRDGQVDDEVQLPIDGGTKYVYATAADVSAYNTWMGSEVISSTDTLKYTSDKETDGFTEKLLNLLNADGFINMYDAYLIVQDDNRQIISSEQHYGDTLPYGSMFNIDLNTVLTGSNALKDTDSVYWSVQIYKNGYDPDSMSNVPTASQKVSCNNTAALMRKADADIVVTAVVVSGVEPQSSIRVEVKDIYGKTAYVDYVDNAANVVAGSTLTINGNEYETPRIPFWQITGWSKSEPVDGVITVTPITSSLPTLNYTVIGGDITSINAKYDSTVSINTSVADFAAWAVLKNGKYQIVSYRPNYSFFAVTSQDYTVIVDNKDGTYSALVDENTKVALTVDNVENALPDCFYENGVLKAKHDNITPNAFLNAKIKEKMPFIYVELAGKGADYARAYFRITAGANAAVTGYGAEVDVASNGFTGPLTFPCNNVLDSGQFILTIQTGNLTLTKFDFTGYVTYDFTHIYTNYYDQQTEYSIAAVDHTSATSALGQF